MRPTNLKNKDNPELTAFRRELVATCRARGMTLREIQQYLSAIDDKTGRPRLLNPISNLPFDTATISRDLKKLREESIKRASETTDVLRAEQLDRVREAIRSAWAQKNLMAIARLTEIEMKLTGTAMPEKREIAVDFIPKIQLVEVIKTYETRAIEE